MKRRFRRLLILAIAFVVCVAAFALSRPKSRLLLRLSTRVPLTGNWQYDGWQAYGWLSTHDVMLWRLEGKPSPAHPRGRWTAYRMGVSGNALVPLVALNSAIRSEPLLAAPPPPKPVVVKPGAGGLGVWYGDGGPVFPNAISTDGRWVTWKHQRIQADCFARVDGLRAFLRPFERPDRYVIRWQPDDSGWIAFEYGRNYKWVRARAHDLARPNVTRSIDLDRLNVQGIRPVMIAPNRAIICDLRRGQPQEQPADMYEIDLGPPTSIRRRWSVTGPAGSHVQFIDVSPTGDRLAWTVDYSKEPSESVFEPLMKLLGDRPYASLGLWVSDLNGRNLHEIGHIQQAESGYRDGFDRVMWRPDGKALSFICKAALWMVPAD